MYLYLTVLYMNSQYKTSNIHLIYISSYVRLLLLIIIIKQVIESILFLLKLYCYIIIIIIIS